MNVIVGFTYIPNWFNIILNLCFYISLILGGFTSFVWGILFIEFMFRK